MSLSASAIQLTNPKSADYFYSAAEPRSRGALCLFFAPARILYGGATESLLRTSPLLEIYKKDIEVLILDDEIDEIIFSGNDKKQRYQPQGRKQSLYQRGLKDEAMESADLQ